LKTKVFNFYQSIEIQHNRKLHLFQNQTARKFLYALDNEKPKNFAAVHSLFSEHFQPDYASDHYEN